MKVLVTGGRNFADDNKLFAFLDGIHAVSPITHLIHGGAYGADGLANCWAVSRSIPVTVYPADWAKFGRAAGPRRNAEMIASKPDLVVATIGGNGTANCVRQAREAGIKIVDCL